MILTSFISNYLGGNMRSQCLVRRFLAGSFCALTATCFAQTPPLTQIVGRPGYSETQANTGVVVQAACINLNNLSGSGVVLTPDQDDLKTECSRMVRTAGNILNGTANSPNLGGSATDETLKQALQRIAPEEMAANSRATIEATAKTIASAIRARLSALRLGAQGLSMNGIEYPAKGRAYASEQIFGHKQRGGVAGEDEGLGSKLGLFVNATYNTGDKNETTREDGFDFDNWSLLGGADYRFTEKFLAGVALGYSQTKVDITRSQGTIDSDAWNVNTYATFNLDKFYIEGTLGYSRNGYDSDRNISYPTGTGTLVQRNAKGSTNGDQFSVGLGAGYDWPLGGFTLTPYGRFEYIKLSIDAFDETGARGLNLHVDSQDADSTQSAFGIRGSYVISTGLGVLVPQASAEWIHEFANRSRNITARYVNDPQNNLIVIPTEQPDRNYFRLSLGLSAVFQRGWSGFVNYENLQGLSNITQHSLLLGMRKEL
jgi:outer membrane autotransporter protein